MDLKKLLAEREAVLKEKETEQLIEVKIEGYSENFKLKVPEKEALIELFKALGIKKFEKEIIDKVFAENLIYSLNQISLKNQQNSWLNLKFKAEMKF